MSLDGQLTDQNACDVNRKDAISWICDVLNEELKNWLQRQVMSVRQCYWQSVAVDELFEQGKGR